MYKQCELDKQIFKRSNQVITNAIEGGKYLTRDELKSALEKIKITGYGVRLGYIIMNAELERLICSGPRIKNQFTYALLDERVPPTTTPAKDDCLKKLSELYFTTRRPAQVADFAMWSGLTLREARAAVKMLPNDFATQNIDGQEYIFKHGQNPFPENEQATFLMPDYDEFGMSYKDRSALVYHRAHRKTTKPESQTFNRMIILDGKIVGSWRRTIKGKSVSIELNINFDLTKMQEQKIARAVDQYCSFIGKEHNGTLF